MSTSPPPHEDEMMSKQDLADLGILGFCGVIEQLGEEIAEKLDPDSPPPGWSQQVTVFVTNWDQIWDVRLRHSFEDWVEIAFPNATVEKIEDGGKVGIFAIAMTTRFVDERGE